MSLEQPLINPSEEPSIIPYEQKMEDKKSCCEYYVIVFLKQWNVVCLVDCFVYYLIDKL